MDILFIPSSELPLPPSGANVLNPIGISKLLANHPNRRFVDALTSIATSGAKLGYIGQNSV